VAGGCLLASLLATTGFWGPRVLAHLAFFHVRVIELRGVVHAPVPELLARLGVDSLQSVWQPLPPLAARVGTHPLVAEAEVRRQLPGTLVVLVRERAPVAWAGDARGVGPVDGDGRRLPIDLRMHPLDLPVAVDADTVLFRLLDALRRDAPGLFARITAVARPAPREVRVSLGPLRVRALPEVTVARFQDILPVEADLARGHVPVEELDLRFRDQVIARTP
jgi:cell division protein FtsQ